MKKISKLIAVLAILLASASFAKGNSDAKKACKSEANASVKAAKVECKKTKDAAVKAADGNNDKRKVASDAMTECVKKAEESKKGMIDACLAKAGDK